MDEQEKLDRLREIRLIVTEILMFLAVVMLVGFLTLIVTGYSFNLKEIGGEGEIVERTGLVQISSIPTGATIEIDGTVPLLLKTNGSRTMLTGEHTIKLSRDGYDTWEKSIEVTEGMMYRVNYPRLFLTNREVETVLQDDEAKAEAVADEKKAKEEIEYTTVSPNKEKMLIVKGGETYMVELNVSKPTAKLLYKEAIAAVEWSGNSERILATTKDGQTVMSVKTATEKVVLSELLQEKNAEVASALQIVDVKFETAAGERLLALLSDGTLREIDVKTKVISEPMARGVARFDNDGDRIVYMTQELVGEEMQNQMRVMRVGAAESTLVRLTKQADAKILTMRYFTETYFAVLDGEMLKVYYAANWPEVEWGIEKVFEEKVELEVGKFEKRGKGMVLALEGERDGERRAEIFDIEAMRTTVFALRGKTGWVDEYMRYEIDDEGKLSVVDYDGLNERMLVETKVDADKAVAISGNGKYLYYFADGTLVRERVN